ncbi:hypothetical protein B1R94_23400 [Mycolicibacterium litorale]|nr:hypothetical protein B1R94_23400 [Mycolicibacterium litorale]
MTVWLVLAAPWVIAALLTLGLPRLEALFAPDWWTRVLAATGVSLALATWTSALALETILGGAGPAAARAAAVVLGGFLLWTLVGCLRHAVRIRANMRASKVFRDSTARTGDVLTVDCATPDAFAVPGRRGVVVVTTALTAALDEQELCAVVSHERAHLRGRHPMLIQAVQLAARLNPMLRRWGEAVRYAAERAADECAATGGRPVAVRAIARAALLCSAAAAPAWPGVGGQPGEVLRRVTALQHPGPRRQRAWLLLAAAAVVLGLAANFLMVADLAQDRLIPEPGEPAVEVLG